MSEDKMDHQDDPKGSSRRSRKDEQGRDYVCGCGKRYLSYPALYTHIKTKHDGHQPEGTQKTGITPISRRTKQKVDEKNLREIQNFVQLENLKILTQLDENALGSIAITNRVKKQLLSKELFQTYNSITKMSSALVLEKKTSLQTVLISYLIGVGQYISDPLLVFYNQFAKLFRNCFHEYAQEIYDICFKGEDRREKTINTEECKMAPLICDFFLRFYVPNQNKDQEFLNVMELICCDFCNWMYSNKLTIVEVSMKKTYQISRRNLIEPISKQKKADSEKQIEEQKEEREQREERDQNHSSCNESEIQKKQQEKQKVESKKSEVENEIQSVKQIQKQINEANPEQEGQKQL